MAGVFLQKQTKLLLISVCYKMDKKPSHQASWFLYS